MLNWSMSIFVQLYENYYDYRNRFDISISFCFIVAFLRSTQQVCKQYARKMKRYGCKTANLQ